MILYNKMFSSSSFIYIHVYIHDLHTVPKNNTHKIQSLIKKQGENYQIAKVNKLICFIQLL